MDHRNIDAGQVAERYVQGRLPEPEASAFETHFLNCEACQERVAMSRALRRGLMTVASEDARTRDAGLARPQPRPIRHPAFSLAAAAALLLAIAPSAWLFVQNKDLKNQLAGISSQTPGATATSSQPQVQTQYLALSQTRSDSAAGTLPFELVPGNQDTWHMISLELAFPQEQYYAAVLHDPDGKPCWQARNLPLNHMDALSISFPSTFFKPGAYRFEVRGMQAPPDAQPSRFQVLVRPKN